MLDFRALPDASLVALAEVHRGRLEEGAALCGGNARKYPDFRALLDDRQVDAVVISTPDHWHALMTMMACAAGKDVYVEKPLSLFVREGRWMTDVARRCNRIVQVGTQQRSGPHFQKGAELVRSGRIGQVVSARMWFYRNVMPGFGSPPDADPPPELDYDMWLGPAPKRRYNPNRSIYHFRWFWDYSGGQMTNLAQHSLDIVHWYLGATAPRAVSSSGGRFALRDNGETPDTQDALFEYDGWTASWSHREASRGAAPTRGLEFCGTEGSLLISRKGFTLTPDPKTRPGAGRPPVRRCPPRRRTARKRARRCPRPAHEPDRGPQRRRIRPVSPPRPRVSRLRALAQGAVLQPGDRSSRGDGLSSRQPVAPAGPQAEVGRASRDDHR